MKFIQGTRGILTEMRKPARPHNMAVMLKTVMRGLPVNLLLDIV